jgi:hypothetical protein
MDMRADVSSSGKIIRKITDIADIREYIYDQALRRWALTYCVDLDDAQARVSDGAGPSSEEGSMEVCSEEPFMITDESESVGEY